MKQLILFFCLVALVPLGISAQEDHDIVASLNLKEVVILADGQTFEEYLIKQVLDHAQPLKKRVRTLSYSVTCKMEKDMDLTQIPHRRTITFAAKLAGYGQIVKALMEHKEFGITAAEDILYEKVREKAKELKKQYRKNRETDMRYLGSYTSGGRTIFKVSIDNLQVHIVDGCWQIKMMDYIEGQNKVHLEFSEIKPDLFLLSHSNAKLYVDRKKWPNGYISMELAYKYR
jgi:hypothetical protein